MLELLSKGGPTIWILLAMFLLAMGIFLERLMELHRGKMEVGEFLTGMANHLSKKKHGEALAEASGTPGPVARVVQAALGRTEMTRAELKEVVQEAAQLEIPRMERYVTFLLSLSQLGPLIGIIGTLISLTDVFASASQAGGFTNNADVAKGIYQSLIACAMGMTVAVPSYSMYLVIASLIRKRIDDMNRAGIEIVDVIISHRQPEAIETTASSSEDSQIINFRAQAINPTR
jgi:biopolymer transport protein ExbB